MNRKRVVVPIIVSSVVLMLSAAVVMSKGTHAAESIQLGHAADKTVETRGAHQ